MELKVFAKNFLRPSLSVWVRIYKQAKEAVAVVAAAVVAAAAVVIRNFISVAKTTKTHVSLLDLFKK